MEFQILESGELAVLLNGSVLLTISLLDLEQDDVISRLSPTQKTFLGGISVELQQSVDQERPTSSRNDLPVDTSKLDNAVMAMLAIKQLMQNSMDISKLSCIFMHLPPPNEYTTMEK